MGTRRELLKTAAAVVAAPAARGQHQHDSGLVRIPKPYTPRVLKPAQMEWVAKLVDLIIPRSDTPGASDAGVPAYIDRALRRNAKTKERFLEGIKQLDAAAWEKHGAAFSELKAELQTEMLSSISGERSSPLGRFFKLAKDLTIDGYYTSKPGLTGELGWSANTFLSEFKGCTHPEHQV
jgi:hypothetical protein